MGIYQDRKLASKMISILVDRILETEDYDEKLSILKETKEWSRIYTNLTVQYYIIILAFILTGIGMLIAAYSHFSSLCPLC